jgi:hypothetical protein
MSERETVRPHIRQRDFVDRNISAIEDHGRKGKVLLPPFSKIAAPMAFHSWKDNCIPNILWACILAAHLEREHYLDLFRKVVVSTRENLRNYEETYITHNHLAVRPEAEFATILDPVLADPEATRLVSALLLLESLPDRHLWAKHVVVTNPEQGWTILAAAVALCLDHQSQRSTDVRWLKLIHIITIGKMIFDAKMKERTEELRLYPDKGDMRTVRPFIRASEMMLRPYEDGDAKPKHVPDSPHLVFWAECYAKTECIVDRKLDRPEDNIEPLVRELLAISDSITTHFASVSDDTGIDPRRDASFGVVLYAVALAMDAARGHSHQLPVGREELCSGQLSRSSLL